MSGCLAGVMGTMGSVPITGSINVGQNGVYNGYGFGPSTGNVSVGSCASGVCYPGLPSFNCSGGTGQFVGFINGGGVDFTILQSQSGKLQSCFTGVRVQDSTGAIREYLTASATGFSNSGSTQWWWGNGSNPVWPIGFSGARSVEWF